jgi:hypothetical protein
MYNFILPVHSVDRKQICVKLAKTYRWQPMLAANSALCLASAMAFWADMGSASISACSARAWLGIKKFGIPIPLPQIGITILEFQ